MVGENGQIQYLVDEVKKIGDNGLGKLTDNKETTVQKDIHFINELI